MHNPPAKCRVVRVGNYSYSGTERIINCSTSGQTQNLMMVFLFVILERSKAKNVRYWSLATEPFSPSAPTGLPVSFREWIQHSFDRACDDAGGRKP